MLSLQTKTTAYRIRDVLNLHAVVRLLAPHPSEGGLLAPHPREGGPLTMHLKHIH